MYDMDGKSLKYRTMLRVRRSKIDQWMWVEQPNNIRFTTTAIQPKNTVIRKQLELHEVVNMVEQ